MSDKKLRGLGSLISRTSEQTPQAATATAMDTESGVAEGAQLIEIPVDNIVPNPRQPRRIFDKEAIAELASSINQHGLLQPVIVRQIGDKYELIAGERRWRATKEAGKQTITAVAKPADNTESLTLSIIENLQREDLDPIEEAIAYRTLITELSLTQEQVAGHVGKDRSTISNALRLLDLPLGIQAKLQGGSLTPGHARVLLAISDPLEQQRLAERASDRGLSVRELERIVYGADSETPAGGESTTSAVGTTGARTKPAHITDLEQRIASRLSTSVKIKEGRRGGKLIISFANGKEFLAILEILGISGAEI